jgi:Flp pilus assembly protein TadG
VRPPSDLPNGRNARPGRAFRRLARRERGAVLVEFALALPIMTTVMCGIIDYSLVMFTVNNLTTAVREGARVAATLKWDAASTANDRALVQTRVRDQITFNFVDRGGSPGTVNVTAPDANGDIVVSLTGYTYVPVTPVAAAFGLDNMTLARQAVFRHERYTAP